jgi:hypothetical protein
MWWWAGAMSATAPMPLWPLLSPPWAGLEASIGAAEQVLAAKPSTRGRRMTQRRGSAWERRACRGRDGEDEGEGEGEARRSVTTRPSLARAARRACLAAGDLPPHPPRRSTTRCNLEATLCTAPPQASIRASSSRIHQAASHALSAPRPRRRCAAACGALPLDGRTPPCRPARRRQQRAAAARRRGTHAAPPGPWPRCDSAPLRRLLVRGPRHEHVRVTLTSSVRPASCSTPRSRASSSPGRESRSSATSSRQRRSAQSRMRGSSSICWFTNAPRRSACGREKGEERCRRESDARSCLWGVRGAVITAAAI